MNFADYLTADHIMLEQKVSSKKKALEQAAHKIHSKSGIDEKLIFERLIARENLGSTAVGKHIAIPHCRLANLADPILCLMRVVEGVDYDSPDDLPVKIFIVLVVPEDATQHHLDLLSNIVSYFNDSVVVEQILEAKDEIEILNILKDHS